MGLCRWDEYSWKPSWLAMDKNAIPLKHGKRVECRVRLVLRVEADVHQVATRSVLL